MENLEINKKEHDFINCLDYKSLEKNNPDFYLAFDEYSNLLELPKSNKLLHQFLIDVLCKITFNFTSIEKLEDLHFRYSDIIDHDNKSYASIIIVTKIRISNFSYYIEISKSEDNFYIFKEKEILNYYNGVEEPLPF